MNTNRTRILEFLKERKDEWFDDDELSRVLGIRPRQTVNQICRKLARSGIIKRRIIDGKLKNSYAINKTKVCSKVEKVSMKIAKVEVFSVGLDGLSRICYNEEEGLTEDEVKACLELCFQNKGFNVEVAYGGAHGPDIVARKESKKLIIEAKGEGSRPEMRENYFLAIIGEICKHMKDPKAFYAIALPAHKDFIKKTQKLPQLARQVLGIGFIFVRKKEDGVYYLYMLKDKLDFLTPR